MEAFTKHELDKLKSLCKTECTDEEDKLLEKNLTSILSHLEELQTANTETLIGRHDILECSANRLDEDKPSGSLSSEDFLINAPDHVGGMIKVPTVIEFDE